MLPDAVGLLPSAVDDDLDGMALVCFPGSQCAQYPAAVVYDALAKEVDILDREVKRGGAGYLFRLVCYLLIQPVSFSATSH